MLFNVSFSISPLFVSMSSHSFSFYLQFSSSISTDNKWLIFITILTCYSVTKRVHNDFLGLIIINIWTQQISISMCVSVCEDEIKRMIWVCEWNQKMCLDIYYNVLHEHIKIWNKKGLTDSKVLLMLTSSESKQKTIKINNNHMSISLANGLCLFTFFYF
jgi:hypothetical protein